MQTAAFVISSCHTFNALKVALFRLPHGQQNSFIQTTAAVAYSCFQFKLIMVPYGQLDIREPGTDISIAALCEVGESVFIHYTA